MCYYNIIIAKPPFTKPPLCELPKEVELGAGVRDLVHASWRLLGQLILLLLLLV